MKVWIQVKDITNEVYTSKSQEIGHTEKEALMKLVKNLKDLTSFCLDTLYGEVHFNPAHIVTIRVNIEGEE